MQGKSLSTIQRCPQNQSVIGPNPPLTTARRPSHSQTHLVYTRCIAGPSPVQLEETALGEFWSKQPCTRLLISLLVISHRVRSGRRRSLIDNNIVAPKPLPPIDGYTSAWSTSRYVIGPFLLCEVFNFVLLL
jgi:hypothetical protein